MSFPTNFVKFQRHCNNVTAMELCFFWLIPQSAGVGAQALEMTCHLPLVPRRSVGASPMAQLHACFHLVPSDLTLLQASESTPH